MEKKVVSVREALRLTPTRELEKWTVVEYMLDDLGPFSIEMKKAEFSWDKVKQDMEAQEKGLKSIS